ncbi:hypothetical protein GALL_449720 [mine drainage metagenome]|uniref:Uncharacterized protein n=1 Tax=mine drainage metagenome TaxID=410659 RepID=A0A1J5PRH2_9ZZZZ
MITKRMVIPSVSCTSDTAALIACEASFITVRFTPGGRLA